MLAGGAIGRGSRAAVLLVTALALLSGLPFEPAHAQEQRRESRGLFDFLFGGAIRRAEPPEAEPQRQQRVRRAAPRRSGNAAPAPPQTPSVEKLENARVVLVVGDFLAGGLAEGLETAYAESPGVRIVDRTNGSSGFVRDDFYDWNAAIGPILEEEEPAVVVVMIGSNDRQQIVVDGKRENPRSEAWLEEYVRRVTHFAETVTEDDVPLIWTGVTPFKSSSMSSDMLAFNDIYKRVAEQVGGEFVDIWDGFVDENGSFVFTGPDMNGQPVRLRSGDGINLTRTARRKIAFYVEKPLNKLLGDAVSPDIGTQDIENLLDFGLFPEEPVARDRTGPISLAEPDLTEGAELLGGLAPAERDATAPKPAATDPADADVTAAVPAGRADNFSLRRAPAATQTEEKAASAP